MITLIVPARDEAQGIGALLQDLHAQRYPRERTEVIVVDDGSSDGTVAIVEGMLKAWPQLRLMHNAGSGKKAAITTGVEAARAELIVLTDADVRCGPGRLGALAAHWARDRSDLVILPVMTDGTDLLGRIQADEQVALLGMAFGTAATGRPTLAYGANLAFARTAFLAVDGYSGDRFASGDDVMLLERIRAHGRRITSLFIPEVLVVAHAQRALGAMLQQRLRWAGKMRGVRGGMNVFGLLALAFPWALLVITVAFDHRANMGQGAFYTSLLIAGAWCSWTIPILALVNDVRRLLQRRASLGGTVLSLIAFSIYAPLIAAASMFVRPMWKGRRIG